MEIPSFSPPLLIQLPEMGSTNSYLREELLPDAEEGTVVQTAYQRSGRGLGSNAWYSERGKNLLMSMLLRPEFLFAQQLFLLNKAVSLALHDCLAKQLPGHELKVKWPNDILVENKKVAGILIENTIEGSRVKHSIIGIGINANQEKFPEEIAPRCDSLKCIGDRKVNLDELREELLGYLMMRYRELRQGQWDALDRSYLELLFGYQEIRRFNLDGHSVEAEIAGVSVDGKLILNVDGKLKHLGMKELTFEY